MKRKRAVSCLHPRFQFPVRRKTRTRLTPNVRKRVEVLKEIQDQHDELELFLREERAALEAKYQKLYEALYSKRFDIVNGVVEVEGASSEAAVDQEKDSVAEGTEKQVPEFWLTVMKASDDLAEMVGLNDEGALKYLKDIKSCKIHGLACFKIDFLFDPNPYFKNTVLTKTFHMTEDKKPVLARVIGTEIEWLPGNSLTQKFMNTKPEEGAKNAEPMFAYIEDSQSFFSFFNVVPDDESYIENNDEKLQDQMSEDYDIGLLIRDSIIPYAVLWFTGKANEDNKFARSMKRKRTTRCKVPNPFTEAFFESSSDSGEDDEVMGDDDVMGEQPPECKQQQ